MELFQYFLELRTLQQLALDEQKNFPAVVEVALSQTYVDDIYAGVDSEDEAIESESSSEMPYSLQRLS